MAGQSERKCYRLGRSLGIVLPIGWIRANAVTDGSMLRVYWAGNICVVEPVRHDVDLIDTVDRAKKAVAAGLVRQEGST